MTMAVRASIKGGLDDEKAFEIARNYCLRMDKSSDVQSIASMTYNMALNLCREVYRIGIKSSLSPDIRKCCTFISCNLYTPLSLKILAKATNMSTRSLSERFHKEMNITPMAYVQKCRIHEAKFLLFYTEYSLLDISNALHFSSQSYFTNIFRQFTGITPKQYRINK
jgi:transcriptional regulator GlxA family with amidase domain